MIVWDGPMFKKWYSLPNGAGSMTTYSRVGWRYWRGPNTEWGYIPTPDWIPQGQKKDPALHPDHPLNEYRHRVERLFAQFPIPAESRILVLGCGTGYLPEMFIWRKMQMNIPEAEAKAQVAGLDNSAFIQGTLSGELHPLMFEGTTPKVGNRDYRSGAGNAQVRGNLRQIWGGSELGDFVIVESVDESYTAAERTNTYYTALESYLTSGRSKANVIHIVCDGWDATADGGSPAMTLEEWAATRPAHSWASYRGDMRTIAGTG